MYSWEIDRIIRENNNMIKSDIYIDICKTSPQIDHIKYNSFENIIEMWTIDNYYWCICLI